MNIDEMYEKVEKLREWAEMEMSETGDLARSLCDIYSCVLGYASEDFQKAVTKEICDMLDWYEDNATIVERKETYTRTIVELQFKD